MAGRRRAKLDFETNFAGGEGEQVTPRSVT
jgi:hypothetical protein